MDDKPGWLMRVLGVDVASAAGTLDPAAIWREAKEKADARLAALSASLRSTDDPDLTRIAEFGLFGLTDGAGVGMMRAVLEYGGAGPDRRPAAAQALRKAVDAYRTMLDGNEIVALVDDNPFGVDVGLRATLGTALTRVEAALA